MELMPKLLLGAIGLCALMMMYCGIQIIIWNININKLDRQIAELDALRDKEEYETKITCRKNKRIRCNREIQKDDDR